MAKGSTKRKRGNKDVPSIYRESLEVQLLVLRLGKTLAPGRVAKLLGLNHISVMRLLEDGVPWATIAEPHKCKWCTRRIETNYCVACFLKLGLVDEYPTKRLF